MKEIDESAKNGEQNEKLSRIYGISKKVVAIIIVLLGSILQ